jgi:Zn-dependent protease with chaperone function
MTFELRLATIVFAALLAGALAGALAAPLAARRLSARDSFLRARQLLRLRLLPGAAGIAAALVAGLSFLVFEPRRADETMGAALPVVALLGALAAAAVGSRTAAAVISTKRLASRWLRGATPIAIEGASVPAFAIESEFPVVAVVGLRRPRLIVANSVLRSCSADEMRAIVAHEHGHVAHHDNLRRMLLSVAPDPLGWIRSSRSTFADWRCATEEAADDAASAGDEQRRLHLASALVKVARLASASPPVVVPASAFFCAEDLDRRVRRLLQPQAPAAGRRRLAPLAALASAGVGSAFALEGVHALIEVTVQVLP